MQEEHADLEHKQGALEQTDACFSQSESFGGLIFNDKIVYTSPVQIMAGKVFLTIGFPQ